MAIFNSYVSLPEGTYLTLFNHPKSDQWFWAIPFDRPVRAELLTWLCGFQFHKSWWVDVEMFILQRWYEFSKRLGGEKLILVGCSRKIPKGLAVSHCHIYMYTIKSVCILYIYYIYILYIYYIYYIYIHNLFSVHSKWLFFDHPKFLNSTRSLDFKNLSSGTSLHRKGTPGFRRPWVSRRFPEGAFGIFFPENKDLIHGKKGFWWFWSMDLTCFNHENWGFINGLDGTQL
jgi:hypothetical protein